VGGEEHAGAQGAAVETRASALSADVPRRLRSTATVLVRVAIGFALGVVFGGAIMHRGGASFLDALTIGAGFGLAVGVAVGIFLWVLFPYEPRQMPDRFDNESATESR
jgi:hypothetical protein